MELLEVFFFDLIFKCKCKIGNILDPKVLSEWILNDGLKIRMQLQLHKYIWSADTKGV